MRQDAQMTQSQFQHMPHMFHVPIRYVEKISNVESSRGTGGGVGPPLSNFSVLGLRHWPLYPVCYAVLRGWCPELHRPQAISQITSVEIPCLFALLQVNYSHVCIYLFYFYNLFIYLFSYLNQATPAQQYISLKNVNLIMRYKL